jgi:hypothetical protein
VERMLAGMAVFATALVLVGMGVIVFGDVGGESTETRGDRVAGTRSNDEPEGSSRNEPEGSSRNEPEGSSRNEPEGCGRAHEPSSPRVRADEGLYAVAVPQGWEGSARGSVVTLSDKRGRARLAVGLAPAGDLTSALDDLRSNLGRSYRGLHVTGLSQLEVGGCPARSIVGRALTQDGVRLSFEGMVVAGPENNYALAGFVVRGAERRLGDDLNRAMRSLHAPGGN